MKRLGWVLTVIAVAMFALTAFSERASADTMFMCISDSLSSANSSCTGGDSVLLSSDGSTITATTSGTASILTDATTANTLSFIGSVGVFTFTVNIGTVQASANNVLDLNFISDSTMAGTLIAQFLGWPGSGFTSPTSFSGTGGGTADMVTGSITGCFEDIALPSGCGNAFESIIGTSAFTTSPFSTTFAAASAPFSPFGLGLELQLNATGPSSSSGNFSLVPVPEPATLLLLGSGLLGAAGFTRKRLRLRKSAEKSV
jgi:PEP-CTERM motif